MYVAQNIFVNEYGTVKVYSRFQSADSALIVADEIFESGG